MSLNDFLVFLALLFGCPACAAPLEETSAPAAPVEAIQSATGRGRRFHAESLAEAAASTAARRTRDEFDARLANAAADRAAQ